ncbi:sodium channel and clathrin linker 1-like isoform X2 [Anopheles funestus]|uniref:sodium channel and clathrin linker 1-like isoform X2 n=1 Tax=Anopheles funestus TaxID=62324 RepID=UPI0020C5E3F8|nr:sodium channel and clathrin linker 1-like isoform X2 [Anopheles funestus]
MSVAIPAPHTKRSGEKCDLLTQFNELYRSIEQEVRSHRHEHERIRTDLQKQLEALGPVYGHDTEPVTEPDYKRVSDEVIRNQQNQIQLIKEEKETFEKLWQSSQRTIRILELEIHEYRRQLKQPKGVLDARQQYAAAVQLLEQNLTGVRAALDEKIAENRHLQREQQAATERVKVLQEDVQAQQRETEALTKAIDELRTSECQLRTNLDRTMRDKSELETLLDTAAALARQHMSRENLALAKVQEALQLADSAIEEKNCIVRREQDAREECDFLASTIGQVMEEAARKVEHELGGLRSGYERRISELEQTLDQTRNALEIEMELKLEALQKTMAKEKETNRACSAREEDLQRLLANSEQLKERWKREMLSVTDELRRKIETMQRENCKLTAENNQLKDQLLMASSPMEAPSRLDGGAQSVIIASTGPTTNGRP